MKKYFILILFSTVLISCNQTNTGNATDNKPAVSAAIENMKTIELNVTGMTCTGCENTIETALSKIDGVVSSEAIHTKASATVSFDSTKVDRVLLTQTINNLGYQVVE